MALKTSRIEALSDGIFSISMTILIITFEILLYPQKGISESGLITTLAELWPDFLHYVVGFVILGAFWMEHHYQFNYIHSVDPALLFAELAKVSTSTVVRFERGEELKQSTIDHFRNVFEHAGIEFIPENGGGVGVRFRKPAG